MDSRILPCTAGSHCLYVASQSSHETYLAITTDPVHIYLHHRSPSVSQPPSHLLLFSLAYERLRAAFAESSRRERRSRKYLKEAGRFKTALFPTAASSKDLNNIAFFPSSFIFACSSCLFRVRIQLATRFVFYYPSRVRYRCQIAFTALWLSSESRVASTRKRSISNFPSSVSPAWPVYSDESTDS